MNTASNIQIWAASYHKKNKQSIKYPINAMDHVYQISFYEAKEEF